MTKDELIKVVHLCTRDFKEFNLIMDAVEAYSSALIAAKPNVICSAKAAEHFKLKSIIMTDKIKEGNELIAKFMGATKQIIPKGGLHGYKEGTELWMCIFSDNPDPLSYLSFNSEWDWIMPVVEKIGSLNRNMCGLTIGLFYEGDIVEVWRHVVEFIEWHNANKDENKNVSP